MDVSDTHYSDYGAIDFCGARTFSVVDGSGNAVSWITIAAKAGVANTYTITAAPVSTNAELQATHSYSLKVVSDDYASD